MPSVGSRSDPGFDGHLSCRHGPYEHWRRRKARETHEARQEAGAVGSAARDLPDGQAVRPVDRVAVPRGRAPGLGCVHRARLRRPESLGARHPRLLRRSARGRVHLRAAGRASRVRADRGPDRRGRGRAELPAPRLGRHPGDRRESPAGRGAPRVGAVRDRARRRRRTEPGCAPAREREAAPLPRGTGRPGVRRHRRGRRGPPRCARSPSTSPSCRARSGRRT